MPVVDQISEIRKHLVKLLDWKDAHADFNAAVEGTPQRLRGAVPPGWEYSAWQLVEHIRMAQADILEFCLSAKYKAKRWPDDYWPKSPAPRNAAAWSGSVAGVRRDRRALQRPAADETVDLTAAIPHRGGQTYFREILLVVDHTPYHVRPVVPPRPPLGGWKSP